MNQESARDARAMISRRHVIKALAVAAALAGTARSAGAGESPAGRFGPLKSDPQQILDLPAGFDYAVIARAGDEMDDGLLVPGRADGMAALAGADGQIILICNHENHPLGSGPFGAENERLERLDSRFIYDRGDGSTPGLGGTTTTVYAPAERRVVRRFLSLAGTEINCAGGPTPWGSWLSCEECFEDPGTSFERNGLVMREQRHGYIFEVPADATTPAEPVPLTAMGRFEHEAAAVDPESGIIYLSEDKHDSLLYRFLPKVPGHLTHGGRLQALALSGHPGHDTRNWDDPDSMPRDRWFEVTWLDLDDVDGDANDLRLRGHDQGGTLFARGEGLCYAEGSVFLTATIGGPRRLGQIFELRLPTNREPGALRMIAEADTDSLLRHADNLTMSPWGDLIICEDTVSQCSLIGMTPDGQQYKIADNPYTNSELAGVCFSPDNSILFVNVQDRGLTLAITGPFHTA